MPAQPSKNALFKPRRNRTRATIFQLIFLASLLVFLLTPRSSAQTVTDIYDFTGGSDGWDPSVPMIAGPDGSLYGTTNSGGYLDCGGGFGYGCGTVYRLSPSGGQWIESTLYQFHGGKDGFGGYSSLALDSAGNLYGVTFGGKSYGAVFRLVPGAPGKHWRFELLYEFRGQRDGATPISPLFLDSSGAIYGVSQEGGLSGKGCNPQSSGCGAIFQLVPPTHEHGPWTANVLYEFQGANDGGSPTTVLMDSTGTIYGTTAYGGKFNKNCTSGCGVVFELFPVQGTWAYKVLYSFAGASHQGPSGSLIKDASGNLYGLVGRGPYGAGDIYQLSPPAGGSGPWTLTYLHRYGSNYPANNLAVGPTGTIYGSIYGDQDLDWGYIFQLVPQGGAWAYTTLVNFNKDPISQNPAGVVVGFQGDVYSPVSGGGYGNGSIVSVVP